MNENGFECDWVDTCYEVHSLLQGIGEANQYHVYDSSECLNYNDDETTCNDYILTNGVSCHFQLLCQPVREI